MITKHSLGALVLALSAVAAHAGDAIPQRGEQQAHALTRSEVIADLHLWRRAGMDRFDVEGVDYNSPAYLQASAAYSRLRNSAAYDDEVRQVAAKRHEVVASIGSSGTVQ